MLSLVPWPVSASSPSSGAYLKPYQFEDISSENLKSILNQNIRIFEIQPASDYKNVKVHVDIWQNGKMQEQSALETSLSQNEVNYLAIRTLGDGVFSIELRCI